jgi:hypothetical protein
LAGLAILYMALLLNAVKFAYNAYLSAIYPGELDYGEGVVWQQAKLIFSSRMYGDLQQYPFLVFHYPPLYHIVVNAISSSGVSWLVAARTVSSLSLFAIAVFTGLFVLEGARQPGDQVRPHLDPARLAPIAAALVAGLLIVSLDPLRYWARTARVDMLAYAFQSIGMYLGLRALNRRGQFYTASFFFVAALFTKQTVIAGAMATFVVAFTHDRRRALSAALAAGTFGVAVFAALSIMTDGGFFRHVVLYNVNRFSMSAAYHVGLGIAAENIAPAYAIIAVISLCALVLRGVSTGLTPSAQIIAIYAVLAIASLVTLGKTGSASNYFISVVCGIAILAGTAVAESGRRIADSRGYAVTCLALVAALITQTLILPRAGERVLVNPDRRRQIAELTSMIRAAPRPVFSEDMVLLMQAGKEIPWEPSIITELSAKGVFDEQKIIALIDARTFAFAVEDDGQSPSLIVQRYSPGIYRSLQTAFPVTRLLAGKNVMLPANP